MVSAASEMSSPLSSGAVIEPGTELAGRYRVQRLVGEGGMGAVYEAEHTIIGRRVAVKVLHPKYCVQHDAVVRFTREARAAAAIGHENIVDVTDFGTHEGQPFLVMELLRGVTLDELMVHREVFEPKRACEIVGYVLSALASAHAAGIVHRDLKPENVFLAEGGARASVKILDFGISKFQQPSDNLVTTEDGAMLGTPSYMSPEQWLGERDIDHRADLYAVGVLLYEMLTGHLPYEASTRGDLMLRVVTGTTPAPLPSTLTEGVSPELDVVALKAVARGRAERYQTAQEFLEALRPFGAAHIEVTPALPASAPLVASDGLTGPVRVLTASRAMSTPRGAHDPRRVPTLNEAPADEPLYPSVVPPPLWQSPVALLGVAGLLAALAGALVVARASTGHTPAPQARAVTRPVVPPPPPTTPAPAPIARPTEADAALPGAQALVDPPGITAPVDPQARRHRGRPDAGVDEARPSRTRRRRHGLDINRHF